jgi:ADP-sugar diphosphatase
MSQKLLESHKIRLWKHRLESNGNQVRGIEELYSKYTAKGNLLFALINAEAVSAEGDPMLPLCFIKGEVVCVLICLIDQQTRKKYLLLVRQRRICDGSLTYEHPAGMLDEESDPYTVAQREVYEETGLEVSRAQLVHLNPEKTLFPTTATSDEAMYLLYTELELSGEAIRRLHLQQHGEASENESITTHVVEFEEGYRLISNTNGLLHCFLYLTEVGDWEMLKRLKKR